MRKIFLHIPVLLLLASAANSQVSSISLNNMEEPKTELFYSQEFPKAGDTLYLKITIPEGWHINANKVLDEFLVPSAIEPIAEGIKFEPVLWPQPSKVYNEVLNINLLLLKDSFTVSLPLSYVSETANPYMAKLKFTYQACSNICLAPKTIEIFFDNMAVSEKKNGSGNGEIAKKIESETKKKYPFVLYFLLAMLGGLLLNVMPCVLPVLFLKMFDLIRKSDKTNNDMLKWGLASAGGIWSSFLLIAIIICSVRLTGNAIGWGFQFQYPIYTAVMAVGIAIFALSFFGVFEIWMPSNVLNFWDKKTKEDGVHGAFAYGVMLVCLSTPCSAPFLGTAIGFAFTVSIVELFLIFVAVAIGLSLPYLILGFFPQWTKKLPQPGSWMVVFKQFLGFPLVLTTVWLVWIFYKQMGATASLRLAILICFAGFFAWLSGLIANPGKPWLRFAILWIIFMAVSIFSWNWLINSQTRDADFSEANIEEIKWLPFSTQALDSLQNEGIAVWINGAADWCITCKINEKNVFENEKIKKIFEKFPIAKMQADYTKPNYEALKFFELHGRGGVPFDLLITSSGEAILLPELLTEDTVIEALEKAY